MDHWLLEHWLFPFDRTYQLLITGYMIALETVYDPALHLFWVLVCIVHRGNSKDPWKKKQGTPQTTLSHPCTYTMNRTPYHRHQLQHHRQAGLGAGQDHSGVNLHEGKQSYFKPTHC